MCRVCATIAVFIFLLFITGGCSGSGAGMTAPDTTHGDDSYDANPLDGYRTAGADVDIIIKTAPNTVKIKRDDDISSFNDKAAIRAARNEHEAFQVIPVPAAGVYLHDVRIGLSDLYGPNEEFFSRENFTYFLEGYIYHPTASDAGGDTGWFPDPLIPISDPFEVDTTVGLQPVWIDCYVPPGTTPGVYTGNVVVSASGGLMDSIPLRLKVLNLTLGDEFRLKTAFGLNRECINDYHGFDNGEIGPEVNAVREKYMKALLDNGVSFWGLDWFKPSYVVNPDDTVTVDFSAIDARIDEYLLGGKYTMSAFQFPLRLWDLYYSRMAADTTVGSEVWRNRVTSYIGECGKYLESRGVFDRNFVFIIDEPQSAQDYQNVRYLGTFLEEVDPRPNFLVTEQPYSSNMMDWGSILEYVDIFCPAIFLVDPDGGTDPNDPYFTEPHNFEQWLYTNTNVHPFAGYAIDHPALEPRMLAYMCYRRNIGGVFYWSANYWKLANPWSDPYTLGDPIYGSGNGSLMYPGSYINQYTGQDDIDGPISSIRLEQIREGLEDYEYLMEIANGEPIPELDLIVPALDDFLKDGGLFYRLRNIATEYFFGGD